MEIDKVSNNLKTKCVMYVVHVCIFNTGQRKETHSKEKVLNCG